MKSICLVCQCCLIACLLVLPGWAQRGVPETDALPVVRSVGEFNDLLAEKADALEMNLFKVKVAGAAKRMSPKKLLMRSLWYNHACGYGFLDNGNNVYTYRFPQKDCSRMLAAYRNPELKSELNATELLALQKAEMRVRSLVKPGMNRYTTTKVLHDHLVRRVQYSKKLGGSCTNMLLKDGGVCEAYTRTMYLLLNMAGVPCYSICGRAGGSHAWNLVQLDDGEWYHLDATWDDPVGSKDMRHVSYNYFCIPDSTLIAKRQWNRKAYPPSGKVDAMYYRQSGCYHKDYESYWGAASRASSRGKLRYTGYVACFTNVKSFGKQVQQKNREGSDFSVRAYSGCRLGKGGTATVYLHPGKNKVVDREAEEEKEPEVPVETLASAASWMPLDVWKDLIEDFDLQEALEKGDEILQESRNAAGEAAEKLQEHGQNLIKNVRKGLLYSL